MDLVDTSSTGSSDYMCKIFFFLTQICCKIFFCMCISLTKTETNEYFS